MSHDSEMAKKLMATFLKVAKHTNELRAALDEIETKTKPLAPSELIEDSQRVAFQAYSHVDKCGNHICTHAEPLTKSMFLMAWALENGAKIATTLGETCIADDFSVMAKHLGDVTARLRAFDERYLPMLKKFKDEPTIDADKRTRVE